MASLGTTKEGAKYRMAAKSFSHLYIVYFFFTYLRLPATQMYEH